MASRPAETRWGILSTGAIAGTFSKDLLIDPSTRDVGDVRHRITAVASRGGQSGVDKAREFIAKHGLDKNGQSIQALGTYEELYKSDDVDVIYVSSPHSHHYEHVRDALQAGKHVLCEKAITVNAAQAKALCELALKQKRLLVEGCWTRYFPISQHIQRLLHEEKAIGEILQINAELCPAFDPSTLPKESRLIDPALAGGALLDLGPYPWLWTSMTSGPVPKITGQSSLDSPLPIPEVKATMRLARHHPDGEVDDTTSALLRFPDGPICHFDCSLSRRTPSDAAVVVYGSRGQLNVHFPPFRAQQFTIRAWNSTESFNDLRAKPDREETIEYPLPGGAHGFVYEQDAIARCIRDGQLESEVSSWAHTIQEMTVFDEMRKQGGLKYPDAIEKL